MKRIRPFILSFVLCCLLWASLPASAQSLPSVVPSSLNGEVRVAGNNALAPLTQNLATLFNLAGFTGTIALSPSDSASALEALCRGELDIALTDRLITLAETNNCTATNQTAYALRVANDALMVVVSTQNSFLVDLSTPELQNLFSTALSWEQGRAGLPSDPVTRLLPAQETSEFQFFVSAVYGGNATPLLTGIGTQFSTDQTILLQGTGSNPLALSFLSAALVNRNSTLVRAVSINGISPSAENVANGSYALTRPLYFYVTNSSMQKAQVAGFVNYALTSAPNEVTPLGLYPAGAQATSQAISDYFAALGQSVASVTPSPTDLPADASSDANNALDESADADLVDESVLPVETVTTTGGTSGVTGNPADADVSKLLLDARTDLELLASAVFGVERPEGWTGGVSPSDPQLNLLTRLDLEVLVATRLGNPPAGWFGIYSSAPFAIARDIRHDLELAADAVYGVGQRPSNWIGADPLYRCNRATQTLVGLMLRGGLFVLNVPLDAPNYCAEVEAQVSVFSETNLLTRPFNEPIFSAELRETLQGGITIDTDFAVAFFDRGASQRAGVIPNGTLVVPIARSYTRFSSMTLVQGDGFVLYVNWNDTTLEEGKWRALPDIDAVGNVTSCSADFCSGE